MDIFSGGNRTVVFSALWLSRGDLVTSDPWLGAALSALTSACPDTILTSSQQRSDNTSDILLCWDSDGTSWCVAWSSSFLLSI